MEGSQGELATKTAWLAASIHFWSPFPHVLLVASRSQTAGRPGSGAVAAVMEERESRGEPMSTVPQCSLFFVM